MLNNLKADTFLLYFLNIFILGNVSANKIKINITIFHIHFPYNIYLFSLSLSSSLSVSPYVSLCLLVGNTLSGASSCCENSEKIYLLFSHSVMSDSL